MNSTTSTDLEQNEWLINDDEVATEELAAAAELASGQNPWNILIVDDDVDVHVVTKFALRDVRYKGRPLNFLHAYSGKEGLRVLRDARDVALVLLDVIMETDHAGLLLARQIRGELDNHLIRIVLRTGQSGQTMEQNVIVDYDINDYRTKSDLTTQKLFTTVISSLRAYDSMLAAHQCAQAHKRALAGIRELRTALDRHSAVSITDTDGRIVYVNAQFCALSRYAPEELLGKDYRLLNSAYHQQPFMQELWNTVAQGLTWHGQFNNRARDGHHYWLDTSIIPLLNADGRVHQYLAIHTQIDQADQIT